MHDISWHPGHSRGVETKIIDEPSAPVSTAHSASFVMICPIASMFSPRFSVISFQLSLTED
jgi:hypothetical protein